MDAQSFFEIILYSLGSVLILVLIFLSIRVFFTLEKIDKLIDDLNEKSKKIDCLFDSVDKINDVISGVNAKFVGIAYNVLSIFKKKIKRKKEGNDIDE